MKLLLLFSTVTVVLYVLPVIIFWDLYWLLPSGVCPEGTCNPDLDGTKVFGRFFYLVAVVGLSLSLVDLTNKTKGNINE